MNEWIGHILRHEGFLKMIVGGKNHRRRPRLEFVQRIIKDQKCDSCVQMKRKADNRDMNVEDGCEPNYE